MKKLIAWIKEVRFKVKDYNRIEYDYGVVLCHATLSEMSKTNYDLETIKLVIDRKQLEFHKEIFADDLQHLIEEALTTDGAHHKQWYIEQIASEMDVKVGFEYEKGIAP